MDIVPGAIAVVLLIATPLAFLTSIGLLWLYRRAVFRAMRIRSQSAKSEAVSQEGAALTTEPMQTALQTIILDSHKGVAAKQAVEESAPGALRAPRRVALIYIVAGLGYVLTITISFFLSTQTEFLPLRFVSLCWIYAWPIVLTVNLTVVASQRGKILNILAYFMVLAALDIIAVLISAGTSPGQLVQVWFIFELPTTLLAIAFLNRRVRPVGPLVLIVMLLAVAGSILVPESVVNVPGLARLVAAVQVALGLNVYVVLIALHLFGSVMFGLLGWLILPWIVRLYKRKKINDQSITVDSIWLLFGVVQSVDFLFEKGVWFLASLVAFIVYKMIALGGFSLLRYKSPSARANLNLLLLRVFSLGKRSEHLFDALTLHWRYAGSVQLIAGPDLLTTTIKPHEFLDFLTGKLARRFIDKPETLALRISEMDLQPDSDGRFRVNDFFCYDDTWRTVLSRLIHESDVVLMDLRGFSSQNAGCVFEINELINVMPMRQVLFVIDHTTDESFLQQTLQEAWKQMRPSSPNRLPTSGDLQLFRLRNLGSRELQRFLATLFVVAYTRFETSTAAPVV